MPRELEKEQKELLKLLAKALKEKNGEVPTGEGQPDWFELESIAKRHSVWPLLYDIVSGETEAPEEVKKNIERAGRQCVLQSYRLLMLTKYIVGILRQHDIPAVVLKGVSAAVAYPAPELRKSGDVDVLVFGGKTMQQKVNQLLQEAGLTVASVQHVHYHVVYQTRDGIEVEVHYDLTRKLDDRRFNAAVAESLQNGKKHIVNREIMGVTLPVFDHPYQAYGLLLHMLQHFLFAGFGLRLLCDWVVLWNRESWTEEEKSVFWRLVKDCGICRFAEQVTAVCTEYLGLNREAVSFMDLSETNPQLFLEEIFSSEEFGDSAQERMVMMHGSGLLDYVREFHYQMHINYPRAGRIFLLWPALWIATLYRFIRNNRKIRHVSTFSVLKEAGKRSKLMERVKIFDR